MKLNYQNYLLGLLLCCSFLTYSQVGVNTTNPQAQLDVVASNPSSPNTTDGFLVPRIDTFPVANPTASQQGMLVYLTTTVGVNTSGFYYWDNTSTTWKPIAATSTTNDWSVIGNSGTVSGTNFIGTTDNVSLTIRVNNQRSGLISNSSSSSTFWGYQAGGTGTASGNSAFGHQALNGLTSGNFNTANGFQSAYSNTTGISNTAYGYRSLHNNISGNQNIAVGYQALMNNTGNTNTAIGASAMFSNTTGNNNVSLGYNALYGNISGGQNVAIGTEALTNNTSGGNNVAVGFRALQSSATSFNNNALGSSSLQNNTGSSNNAIGTNALFTNVTGNSNVAVGHFAGYLNTGNRNVFLGFNAGYNETGNDKLYIDNSNTTNPLVYGDFASNLFRINGTLNINNAYNLPTTSGTANQILQTDGAGNTTWVTPSVVVETDPQVSSATNNTIPKWNGTTLIDGLLTDNGTNVGLGTASPVTRFYVASNNTTTNTTIESGNLQYPTALSVLPSSHAFSRRSTIKLDDWQVLQDFTGTGTKDFSIYQGTTGQQRLFIGTNGNVGIGTTAPTSKLEVVGTTTTTNFQMTNGATNGYVLQSDATGTGTWVNSSTLSITENDPQVASTTSNYVPKWNGTALVDGQVFDNGTNVGIGTTTPTNKLEVVGSTSTTNFQMTNGATNNYVLQSDATGNAAWVNPATLSITENDPQVASTTADRVPRWNGTSLVDGAIMDNGSFVGVGALIPQTKLHVVGTVRIEAGRLDFRNTGGSTAVGTDAGINDDQTNNYNTYVGFFSGKASTTGFENVAIGAGALETNSTGFYNTAIGRLAGLNNVTGNRNVFLGYGAGYNETGSDKLYIDSSTTASPLIYGDFASNLLRVNGILNVNNAYNLPTTTGATNQVLQTDGAGNTTWVNASSLAITENDPQVSSITNNTIPKWNGVTLTDGIITDNGTNIGIGTLTPTDKVHVVGSIKVDGGKLPFVNTGESVFIGENAGQNDDLTANQNVFVGKSAGRNNIFGSENTAVGTNALQTNTIGFSNTAIGSGSLYSNDSGNKNVAVGQNSMYNTTAGVANIGIGDWAMYHNLSGNNNVGVGSGALFFDNLGSNNTALGYRAGFNNTGSSNLFLGYTAGYNETGSNKLYIDNSNTNTPLIYGDFSTDVLRINGTLNINNAYNLPTTSGVANQVLQTNGAGVSSWVNSTSLAITENDPQVSSTTTNYMPKWNGTTLIDGQVFDNGTNIGIGTTVPSQKLDVVGNIRGTGVYATNFFQAGAILPNTLSPIAVFNTGGSVPVLIGDSSINRGITIGKNGNDIQGKTNANFTVNSDLLLNPESGNVGIGTFTPIEKLHISGGNILADRGTATSSLTRKLILEGARAVTGSPFTAIDFNNYDSSTSTPYTGASIQSNNTQGTEDGDLRFYTNDGTLTERMNITHAGNVGIGTSTPTQAKLVVNGSSVNTFPSYGYLSRTTVGNSSASVTSDYSIYASDRIAAPEFNAFSDERIKNIKGVSDSKQDLAILSQIQITNYTLKDSIAKGTKQYKKVIAQQVEKVYPQAVSMLTDVIPDIYQQTTISGGFISLANNLKTGEKIKIITTSGEEIVEVLEANSKKIKINTNQSGNVFVYGRQVNDFHTVDYEALSTLNISATQELLKRIEYLEQENTTLKASLNEVSELKTEMETIKKMFSKEQSLNTNN